MTTTKEIVHYIDTDKVRALCIHYDMYTSGTNTDYNSMLNFHNMLPANYENLEHLAKDILEHSSQWINRDWTVDELVLRLFLSATSCYIKDKNL